jgi:diguanylate cyclase (GGDEF)-like protein
VFFVAIVVVPLVAVTVYGWRQVTAGQRRQVAAELDQARRAVSLLLAAQLGQASAAAQALARDPAVQAALAGGKTSQLQQALARFGGTGPGQGEALLLAALAPDGRLLASAGRTVPSFLDGVTPPPLDALLGAAAGGQAQPGGMLGATPAPALDPELALLQRRVVPVARHGCKQLQRGCLLGAIAAGVWLDGVTMQRLDLADPNTDLTVALGPRPVASTLGHLSAQDRLPANDGSGRFRLAGQAIAGQLAPLPFGPAGQPQVLRLLVSVPDPAAGDVAGIDPRLLALLLLLVAVAALLATGLGAALARLVSQPLGELARQARQIARGDFSRQPAAVAASGEVGDLARAFDTMRQELGGYLTALEASREELARAMGRLGETLSATHDLPKLLAVVLEAAVHARKARAGSIQLLSPDRTTLERGATYGLGRRELAERLPVGQGIAGAVAARGTPMVLVVPPKGAAPRTGEPKATTQVSVPLLAQGRVLGVLSLYDRQSPKDGDFTVGDAEALANFAVQAAVAIENVQLHAEAERLSVTDPMTGAWNYRYFERRLEQEIERSRRFGRVFSLLLLDIDHFKWVNDRYGHQRGDEVLVELARRVTASVRDIDTFARYGGEEFVLILPETDVEGALVVAEKLRKLVAGRPFAARPDDPGISLTISIGVAGYPQHAAGPNVLLRAADSAMYEAKVQGRDRVVAARPGLLAIDGGSRTLPGGNAGDGADADANAE